MFNKKKKTNLIAVRYARFSSSKQRGESIEAQFMAIDKFAVENNITIIATYKDEAESGRSVSSRNDFLDMIAESKKGNFNAVIVDKRDRFARNSYDDAIYKQRLQNNGVQILSVKESMLNGERTPENVLLESVVVGMNEYYSLNLARETMKGMLLNAERCIHNGGIPPLGFDIDQNKKYIINENEAEIIREIFTSYLKGSSYRTIAESLNSKGYLNKRGRQFTKNSIRDNLLNEKYIGTYFFGMKDQKGKINDNPIKFENAFPAIISKELFWKVNNKINSRKYGDRKNKTSFLLTGVAICGYCCGNFSGAGKSTGRSLKYSVYGCSNKKSKNTDCQNTLFRKDLFEEKVFSVINDNIFSSEKLNIIISQIQEYIKTHNRVIDKNKLISKTKDIEGKMNRLLTLYLDGNVDEKIYSERYNALNKEIITLNIELSNIQEIEIPSKQKIQDYLLHLKNQFNESSNFEILKQIITTFVQKIIVYRETIEIELNLLSFLEQNITPTSTNIPCSLTIIKNRYSNE